MATYYPNFSQQGDQLSTTNQGEPKPSYRQITFHSGNGVMYSNQDTSAVSFTDIFSGNSLSSHHHVGIHSNGGRNEMVFMPPTGDTVGMQSINDESSTVPGSTDGNSVTGESQVVPKAQLGFFNGEQNFQLQGLSLSLGTDLSSAVSSFQYHNPNLGFSSLVPTHLPVPREGKMSSTGDENHQGKDLGNSDYFASGITGMDPNNAKTEVLCNHHFLGNIKEMNSDSHIYDPSGFTNNILNGKYLKAAQQLLHEVINVRNALKQSESKKNQNKSHCPNDENRKSESQTNVRSSDPDELNDKSSCQLLPAERQDLENKKLKLLSMLDEVDTRYRQYQHELHTVVSSFDRVAGFGAAKPYTELALQTISRHFRCLRDAISGQIQQTRRSLGEQDNSSSGEGGVIPRLRYVDHQLRQQRALQHLGVMRHSWRPQRGLPENAVSILRAWLFEHFLHPYPKDSEKIMLARQTGLSRHQVANWFINARVRLWKPMIEEMYKEEFGDPEMNSKSSKENVSNAPKDQSSASENKGEELQDSVTSMTASGVHAGQINSNSDKTYDVEMNKSTGRTAFKDSPDGDDKGDYKPQGSQMPDSDDCNFYPYGIISTNQTGNSSSMAGPAAYAVPGSGDFTFGSQVSLDLGLRHCERSGFSISGGSHFGVNEIAVSSDGPDNVDYECLELGDQQQRFGNQNMLNNFVA